jgi:hypothetical protein
MKCIRFYWRTVLNVPTTNITGTVILNGYEEEEGVNWLELESLLW